MLTRCITLIWAAWYTLVGISNTFDALKALSVLPATWPVASGNYGAVAACTSVYGTPMFITGLLFMGVIVADLGCAAAFWRALLQGFDVRKAITAGVALWGAFLIADESFVCYAFAQHHVMLLIAHLLTYAAVQLETSAIR